MKRLTATFEVEKMTIANVWQRLRQNGDRGNFAIFIEPKT